MLDPLILMFSDPRETIRGPRAHGFGSSTFTMSPLVLIPTLYVMLEERSRRRVPATEGAPVLQGDMA